MGNTSTVTGSWFSFGEEEKTQVVLQLHDSRCVALTPGEDLVGLIGLGDDESSAAANLSSSSFRTVRRNKPSDFVVTSDTMVIAEFRAVPSRCPSPGNDGIGNARVLGQVLLPLAHIARRCCGCLYQIWLPLSAPWPNFQRSDSPTHARSSPSNDAAKDSSASQFDRALRNAARDPRWPMVCLSLYPMDSLEGFEDRYEANVPREVKGIRFDSLLHSHAQHARLLQALYRHLRSIQQGKKAGHGAARILPQVKDPLDEKLHSLDITKRSTGGPDSFGTTDVSALNPSSRASAATDGPQAEEVSTLKHEIDTTTAEANVRINQASDAIRTLKERLSKEQVQHEKLQKEAARFRHDSDLLEIENERLSLQIERRMRERGPIDSRGEEVKKLRKEADVLREQKEALVQVLEGLYNKDAPGTEAANRVQPLGIAPEGQESFTNMLPRPSELFAGCVTEAGQGR